MNITKLFRLICILPILAGCHPSAEIVPEKELLVVATIDANYKKQMPEEYANRIKESKLVNDYRDTRYDVTPTEFRHLFTLYGTSYGDTDILLYKGELYPVRFVTFPNYTNLAYYRGSGKELIYFTIDVGNMWHRVRVGVYDLKSKQEMTIDVQPPEINTDYVGLIFKPSIKQDNYQLEAYKLESEGVYPSITFTQTDLVYENILQYETITWIEYNKKQ